MTMPASTSLAAYHSLDLPELEYKALEAIASFGKRGCTGDEIMERYPHFTHETLTPRFAPLERKGLIFRNGETRKGKSNRNQKVMRLIDFESVVPVIHVPKKKRNGYMKGFMDAAKIIAKAEDIKAGKKLLREELDRMRTR